MAYSGEIFSPQINRWPKYVSKGPGPPMRSNLKLQKGPSSRCVETTKGHLLVGSSTCERNFFFTEIYVSSAWWQEDKEKAKEPVLLI